jgi:hypothetical protein
MIIFNVAFKPRINTSINKTFSKLKCTLENVSIKIMCNEMIIS